MTFYVHKCIYLTIMHSFAGLFSLKWSWRLFNHLSVQGLLLILGTDKGLNSEQEIQARWGVPLGLCWDLDL